MGTIELMGQLLEGIGGMLGLRAEPPVAMRGFYGMELADSDDGPVVRSVLPKGPAAEGGLEAGDRITHFQGRSVTDIGDVRRFARRLKPGATVKLTVQRGKETRDVSVKTEEGL
jgi:S1-C subfamily serine protease